MQRFLAGLLLCLVFHTGPRSLRAEEASPLPLPPKVVEAWEKVGYRAGWFELPNQYGVAQFRKGSQGKPGELPTFAVFVREESAEGIDEDRPWLQKLNKEERLCLTGLPEPDRPFGLDLSWEDASDSTMKAIARFKKLELLDLSRSPFCEIELSAAGLRELASLPNLHVIKLGRQTMTDDKMKALAAITSLKTIDLTQATKISQAGLNELCALKKLRHLFLNETQFRATDLSDLPLPKGLRTLNLRGIGLTDLGAKAISTLSELTDLSIDQSVVTDEGMKHLAQLKSLRNLTLGSSGTDAGLKYLAELKELRYLTLFCENITDAGLKELANIKKLETLELYSTKINGEGLKELAQLKELESLGINSSEVTDAGLKDISRLTRLRYLSLRSAQVSNLGVKEIAKLHDLKELDLSYTLITDAGLKELAPLQKLEGLFLTGTCVTNRGLKELINLEGLQLVDLRNTWILDSWLKDLMFQVSYATISHHDDFSFNLCATFVVGVLQEISSIRWPKWVMSPAMANLQRARPGLKIDL